MTIKLNEIFDYNLPAFIDPEGTFVTISIDATPAKFINEFATIQPGGNVITFMPREYYQI